MTEEELKQKSIGFISLGCDKNRVDLERIIYECKSFGFRIEQNPKRANIIIINTCSFIESARQESIDTILEMAHFKAFTCEKLIVTGCLTQMGFCDIEQSLPEVDAFVQVKDNENIVEIIGKLYNCEFCRIKQKNPLSRVLTNDPHTAYLKIAEGCDNFCSYCTIPYIRGRFSSVPIEKLVEEAKELANLGTKELILVAQDTLKYGADLYGKPQIVKLIQALSDINGIEWIRVLYCYPERVTDEFILEMTNNPKVCKYIDLPLQHVNNNILKEMNRSIKKEQIEFLISKLRANMPNISIRSTFIIGFPGETRHSFNEILKFLKKQKLNLVGFFPYSREEGTRAFNFKNQISESVKEKRVKKAYNVQKQISKNNNHALVETTVDVIIDTIENGMAIGRSYAYAPNVDFVIYINNPALKVGEIYKVKITATNPYELEGELV